MKKSMFIAKKIRKLSSKRLNFVPETGRVEMTVSKLELKLVMIEIQQKETEAKTGA